MIENTLFNVLILEVKIYRGPNKFYGRSKFGQYDEIKNRVPLYLFKVCPNWYNSMNQTVLEPLQRGVLSGFKTNGEN